MIKVNPNGTIEKTVDDVNLALCFPLDDSCCIVIPSEYELRHYIAIPADLNQAFDKYKGACFDNVWDYLNAYANEMLLDVYDNTEGVLLGQYDFEDYASISDLLEDIYQSLL